ncbi:MAG: hypothetical protein JW993_02175 [Sedimentisphaerales bacterium]|nr:hypothetical protein [Sedimentisphaerales bacterium]
MVERQELIDEQHDILTHPGRQDKIYILSIDPVLATDVYDRIHEDARLKNCEIVRPRATGIREAVEEIAQFAADTTTARLLILDVRRATLPRLRSVFNAIVGYNRKDFNMLCYTLLIGDGPPTLFANGRGLDVFVLYLASHRVDYHPAVFFFDPLLHYEPGEIEARAIDDEFTLPDAIPKRLRHHFRQSDGVNVGKIRRYFRAAGKDDETRHRRQRILKRMYKRRIGEQFPGRENRLKAWMSRRGLHLATERLNLYPLYFEDWVYNLMEQARRNAAAS